jgi:hypothetical protein
VKLLLRRPLEHEWPYLQAGDPQTASPQQGGRVASWAALPEGQRRSVDERAPVRVAMPVHTPGRGVPHIVRAGVAAPGEKWVITGVTGVEFEGALPGPQVRLLDSRSSTGLIEFEVTGVTHEHPLHWLRNFFEVTDDNADLLRPEL